jgi:hypothetical protein
MNNKVVNIVAFMMLAGSATADEFRDNSAQHQYMASGEQFSVLKGVPERYWLKRK